MKRIFKFSILLIVLVLCNSCSELFDCIASTKPELESKTLQSTLSGQPYEDVITASVKNTSNDADFFYIFSIDGDLPPGIMYSEEGRDLVFHGVPTQTGTYSFKVTVLIEYPENYDPEEGFWEDDNRICFGDDSVSKNYSITIQ